MKLPKRFILANIRYKLWKNKRPEMESYRQKATKAAQQIRYDRLENLKDLIRLLPKQLSTPEFYLFVDQIKYQTKTGRQMNKLSLINRIRSKGLMKYSPEDKCWINLMID